MKTYPNPHIKNIKNYLEIHNKLTPTITTYNNNKALKINKQQASKQDKRTRAFRHYQELLTDFKTFETPTHIYIY